MQEAKGQRILIWAVVIFALAFLLRFLHIAAIYKSSPFFDVLPGDLVAYERCAQRIVEQGWLGNEVFLPGPSLVIFPGSSV